MHEELFFATKSSLPRKSVAGLSDCLNIAVDWDVKP